MSKESSVAFVGGGRVARILLEGWKLGDQMPNRIVVVEPDESALDLLREVAPEVSVAGPDDVGGSGLVFLAVHPPAMKEAMDRLAGEVSSEAVVISLVPKVKSAVIADTLGNSRVVRMIPNAPSAVGSGFNPVFFSDSIDAGTREQLKDLFSAWGDQPEVAEDDLEAYAVVSAMGPTYFWYQIQALRELGVSFGLSEEATDMAVSNMLTGAVSCLLEKGPASMDLIPVRPLEELEPTVKEAYESKLRGLFGKLSALPVAVAH